MPIEIDYETQYPNFLVKIPLSTTTISTTSADISLDELCTIST